MSKKQDKKFKESVLKTLEEKLKFYLTEFGQREDLEEIVSEITESANDIYLEKK